MIGCKLGIGKPLNQLVWDGILGIFNGSNKMVVGYYPFTTTNVVNPKSLDTPWYYIAEYGNIYICIYIYIIIITIIIITIIIINYYYYFITIIILL